MRFVPLLLVALALAVGCKKRSDVVPSTGSEAGAPITNGGAGPAHVAATADELAKDCDTGAPKSGLACDDLGDAYAEGKGVAADPAKAAVLYKKACDKGLNLGCNHLAACYAEGKGVTKNREKAIELFKLACDRAFDLACDDLGDFYDKSTPPDYVHAAAAYTSGCDAGYARSCRQLGRHYRDGLGVKKDITLGLSLYEKGCAAGDRVTCYDLGEMYAKGIGVAIDRTKAATWYKKGCDAGFELSCTKLQELK